LAIGALVFYLGGLIAVDSVAGAAGAAAYDFTAVKSCWQGAALGTVVLAFLAQWQQRNGGGK
jgi:hypothetical protein